MEPELSKWERDESHNDKTNDLNKSSSSGKDSTGNSEVTSEIIKRAENAIFAKAVNAIRPDVNKMSSSTPSKSDTAPLSSVIKKTDSDRKYESVQVTADTSGHRSIEIKSDDNSSKRNKSDVGTKPASIKDRLGPKKYDRSRSRSRSRDGRRQQQQQHHQDRDRNNSRRPYQLNSCIGSVSKHSDRRGSDRKPASRRSRSHENHSENKKSNRSRSRTPSRNSHKKPKLNDDRRDQKTSDDKYDSKSVRDKRTKSMERERHRSRHRSRSPKPSSGNSKVNEQRSRSSSTESKKHNKKKKKKDKKSKKKSRG